MGDQKEFFKKRESLINNIASDEILKESSKIVLERMVINQYAYNFDWLGLPILEIGEDILALQEIIWKTKPDVIIETGVARGGSIIFYASMLHLLNKNGKVIGIDIDIRPHNRKAIEEHPLGTNVKLVEGSSIDQSTVDIVKSFIKPTDRVMVILDSNHTHEHVLKELELYNQFVTKDCYMIVLDTGIEDLPNEIFDDRPWGRGNNPKTAVHAFLKETNRFVIDTKIPDKLVLTAAHDGYLLCVK